MRITQTAVLLLAGALAGQAQMSREQRLFDFQSLAAQFAKRYAPYEWKMQTLGFDLLSIRPWLDRVAGVPDDLAYYETCIDYVSSLQDGHLAYLLPSDFSASLGFGVDLYDGKPLIESISRTRLPSRTYPFEIGDELVSIDGVTAADLINAFTKYQQAGNPLSSRRSAAQLLTIRVQDLMPHAPEIGGTASVVILRQNGATETYDIPWTKTGVPLLYAGPVITPKSTGRKAARRQPVITEEEPAPATDWFAPLRGALYSGMPARPKALAGFAAARPVYSVPSGFQVRLGLNGGSDAFFSGTYEAGGKKIGLIRIPSFEPDFDQGIDPSLAVVQFQREITYFQANTDGLIVDVTRNPGGYPDYALELLRRLIPHTFQSARYEMRATAELVKLFSAAYDNARFGGAPQYVVDGARALLDDVRQAYSENRGRTGPLPLDGLLLNPPNPSADIPPAMDRNGGILAYTRPIMLLVDETSFSAADMFPAVMQDNHAALIFGNRTAGLGGVTTGTLYDASAYSESSVSMTLGLMVRNSAIVTPDFPATPYIENVGVRPEVEENYMTRDNLLSKGRKYVEDFTAAMLAYIESKQ